MHYLAVHDFVWINTTVTSKPQPFDYEKLEAAMAAQYSYGDSSQVPAQAANLLARMLLQPPFACGNRRTGFLAVAAYLQANGHALRVTDEEAAQIIRQVAAREIEPAGAIEALSAPADVGLRPGATLRALVTHLCNAHADALQRLTEGDE